MLGTLWLRINRPWIISSLLFNHSLTTQRLGSNPISAIIGGENTRRHNCGTCHCGTRNAPSIWHAIYPSNNRRSWPGPARWRRGEGSWNAAGDVRPARWLHGSQSAWLSFGLCACFDPSYEANDIQRGSNASSSSSNEAVAEKKGSDVEFRITGVLADGRCLFRAITCALCMRNGERALDETHERDLADELRARVANEFVKRRKEIEWFIDEDFDTYVERIQQPHVWGGEPELLMASHVLQVPISVFMIDRRSDDLVRVANYGEEYGKLLNNHITVLFHGYGHYDALEILSPRTDQWK